MADGDKDGSWDVWQSVTEEIIPHSFKVCGLTTALNGSKDNKIHCLKRNVPIPSGLQSHVAKRVEQIAVDFVEDVLIDPKQDDENGYASDDGYVEF